MVTVLIIPINKNNDNSNYSNDDIIIIITVIGVTRLIRNNVTHQFSQEGNNNEAMVVRLLSEPKNL